MSVKSFVEQHARKPRGKTIIFWRSVGGRSSIYTDAIIALALKLRGYKVEFVLCDKIMSSCIVEKGIGVNRACCNGCYSHGSNVLNNYGLSHITYGSLIPNKRRRKFKGIVDSIPRNEIEGYVFHGVPVGTFAKNSLVRYLRGTTIETKRHYQIFREFLYSSLICLEAARIYYHRYKPELAVFQRHFEYTGWGPAYYYFTRNKGVDVVGWQGSIDETKCISMIHCDGSFPVLYQISDAAWDKCKAAKLADKEIAFTDTRLRLSGISKGALLQQLGITDDKPIWCIFPHLHWDPGLCPFQWPFDSIDDWLFTTIQAAMDTPEVTWIFKAHPAERRFKAQGVIQTAMERFPKLRERFVVLSPTTQIRSTDLSLVLSGGITLQGSVSFELPALGVPVLLGNPQYPGKEFTYNITTKEEHIDLIRNAANIERLSAELQTWARKFIYYIFIHKRLPIRAAVSGKGYKPIATGKVSMLLPGKDSVMDMICDSIVNGGEFTV